MLECKTCTYFRRKKPEFQVGYCRRRPPVVVVLSSNQRGTVPVTRWPEVREDDGCGEHSGMATMLRVPE